MISEIVIVYIHLACFSSRRLNTLNKCASMKLDVNLPKKKVSRGFNYYNIILYDDRYDPVQLHSDIV